VPLERTLGDSIGLATAAAAAGNSATSSKLDALRHRVPRSRVIRSGSGITADLADLG
jgi:hypothetical protein